MPRPPGSSAVGARSYKFVKTMPRSNQLLFDLGWFLNNPQAVTVAEMGLRVLRSEGRVVTNVTKRDMANLVRKAQATALCRFFGGEKSRAFKAFRKAKIEFTDHNRRLEAMQMLCSYGRWDPSLRPDLTLKDRACKKLAVREEEPESRHRKLGVRIKVEDEDEEDVVVEKKTPKKPVKRLIKKESPSKVMLLKPQAREARPRRRAATLAQLAWQPDEWEETEESGHRVKVEPKTGRKAAPRIRDTNGVMDHGNAAWLFDSGDDGSGELEDDTLTGYDFQGHQMYQPDNSHLNYMSFMLPPIQAQQTQNTYATQQILPSLGSALNTTGDVYDNSTAPFNAAQFTAGHGTNYNDYDTTVFNPYQHQTLGLGTNLSTAYQLQSQMTAPNFYHYIQNQPHVDMSQFGYQHQQPNMQHQVTNQYQVSNQQQAMIQLRPQSQHHPVLEPQVYPQLRYDSFYQPSQELQVQQYHWTDQTMGDHTMPAHQQQDIDSIAHTLNWLENVEVDTDFLP